MKDDKYDCWYCALNTLASSLIVEVVKLLVDAETSAVAAQKDKRLSAKMAAKT